MSNADALLEYQWSTQPAAGAWVKARADELLAELPWARDFADRLYRLSGNRFYDLIDTVYLPDGDARLQAAIEAGWVVTVESPGRVVYDQPKGMFPSISVVADATFGVELKVESVADFCATNDLTVAIDGPAFAPYRRAIVASSKAATLSAAERHGTRGYSTAAGPSPADVVAVSESFRTRPRDFDDAAEGFAVAGKLIDAAIAKIGRDYTCDLFFAAEREYWTKRNRAAQAQKARQDKLGIGWANHDHHTYRSSRESFKDLVAIWEKLGLFCRERFYAGMAAGWGAQVM
ncbi:hypothetical protein EON77_10540, partial [bacterium]